MTRWMTLIFLLLEVTAADATTYYVATTGSNANPGTSALPFQTIQKAADLVNPGDVVMVNDGTYTYPGAGTACDDFAAVICAHRAGTGSQFIAFRSINPGGAKLNGQSNATPFGVRALASFQEFSGFEIYGAAGAGVYLAYSGTSDFRVLGNVIHNIGRYCYTGDNGLVGIFVSQPRTTIDGNTFHDIGRFANGESGCSQPVGPNHDHGVYTDAAGGGSDQASNFQFSNNICYDLTQGWCLQAAKGSSGYHDFLIAYNTFANNNPLRQGQLLFIEMTTMVRLSIIGNIFYNGNGGGIYYYDGTYSASVSHHNLYYGAPLDVVSAPSGVTESSNITGDPLFTNFATHNFQLLAGSPAIDAGVTVSAVTKDFAGVLRTAGPAPDIGAYEFRVGNVPRPPSGLRVVS